MSAQLITALTIRSARLRGYAASLRASYVPPGTVADDKRKAEIERSVWLAGEFDMLAQAAQQISGPVFVVEADDETGQVTSREVQPGGG